jgi:hypothetical protein
VTPEMPIYKFRYWADMSDVDWAFFQRLGIELHQERARIAFPDSAIELDDKRLVSFYNSEKHCSQACAAIAGVETPPYPFVHQIKTQEISLAWILDDLSVEGFVHQYVDNWINCSGDAHFENFLTIDPRIDRGCVIGRQSWKTYAAAAMGMPVIEILPKDRGVNWLSKWKNPLYRVVEEDHLDKIAGALANLKEILKWRSSKAQADAASATAMAASASCVPTVGSTSVTPTSNSAK